MIDILIILKQLVISSWFSENTEDLISENQALLSYSVIDNPSH